MRVINKLTSHIYKPYRNDDCSLAFHQHESGISGVNCSGMIRSPVLLVGATMFVPLHSPLFEHLIYFSTASGRTMTEFIDVSQLYAAVALFPSLTQTRISVRLK